MSKCPYCDQGDVPKMLDKDGVASGRDGILSHAYDVNWWPCLNQIETAEDYKAAMAACEALIDLDPEPKTLEGRRLAALLAVIQEYESRLEILARRAQATVARESAMNELLGKVGLCEK